MLPRLGYFYVARQMHPGHASPLAASARRDGAHGAAAPCPGDLGMLVRLVALAATAMAVAAMVMWAVG